MFEEANMGMEGAQSPSSGHQLKLLGRSRSETSEPNPTKCSWHRGVLTSICTFKGRWSGSMTAIVKAVWETVPAATAHIHWCGQEL